MACGTGLSRGRSAEMLAIFTRRDCCVINNTGALAIPIITKQKEFACIDARNLAVDEASMIMLYSAEKIDGLGHKWVMWRLPEDREEESFWNNSVGCYCTCLCLEWKQRG